VGARAIARRTFDFRPDFTVEEKEQPQNRLELACTVVWPLIPEDMHRTRAISSPTSHPQLSGEPFSETLTRMGAGLSLHSYNTARDFESQKIQK
jgi:hypothetical protein